MHIINQEIQKLRELFAEAQKGQEMVEAQAGGLETFQYVFSEGACEACAAVDGQYQEKIDAIEAHGKIQQSDLSQLKAAHLSAFDEVERVVNIMKTKSEDIHTLEDGLHELVERFENNFKINEKRVSGKANYVMTSVFG